MSRFCRHVHTTSRGIAASARVIYRDDNVLVLNKPNHVAVHAGTGRRRADSIDGQLDSLKFGYTERPHIVHRLDEATSGALILARTSAVAALLSRLIRRRQIAKEYIAICHKLKAPPNGIIYSPMFTAVDRASNEQRRAYGHFITQSDVSSLAIASAEAEKVRSSGFDCESAATKYSVVCTSANNDISIVRCQLLTGRKQQIRAHMRVISDGIVNDAKHHARTARTPQRDRLPLHLHAYSVTIRLAGVTKRVIVPLPVHMLTMIKSSGLSMGSLENNM